MKLLVTGYNGFLAGSIIAQARKHWEVHGIDIADATGSLKGVSYHKLDLLDAAKVEQLFMDVKPDVVIHSAAMADIDSCENNKIVAEKINIGVTKTIASLCQKINAKMILCSTDTVFDGNKGLYTEEDAPRAVNFYAKTKIEAEQIVLSSSKRNVVSRLSLIMGLPVVNKGNSFLAKTIDLLKKGESVKFPENEIRTPVDVITLGSALVELAGNNFSGIIHLSGNTRINRYEMAKEIAKTLGYSPDLIISVNSNTMPGRAPRPNDASLNNSKAKSILKTPMRSLSEGLQLTMNFKMEE